MVSNNCLYSRVSYKGLMYHWGFGVHSALHMVLSPLVFHIFAQVSALAAVGGPDPKKVTLNILTRLYSRSVAKKINWKGVNGKRAFHQMGAKVLLMCKWLIHSSIRPEQNYEINVLKPFFVFTCV